MYQQFLDVEVTFAFPRPASSTRFDPSPVTFSFRDGSEVFKGEVKHVDIYPRHCYDGVEAFDGVRSVVVRGSFTTAISVGAHMFEFVGDSTITGYLNKWEERAEIEPMTLDELRAQFRQTYC